MVNAALGRAGVLLGLVSAVIGAATVCYALVTGRRHVLKQVTTFISAKLRSLNTENGTSGS